MMFFILFDLCMALIMFFFGLYFRKSKGKTANLLTGYNMRTDEERKRFDEDAMCKNYGIRMMLMSVPFLGGAVIDRFQSGVGCLLAWAVWAVLLVLLIRKRTKMER